MPLTLATPVERKPITKVEVIYFNLDNRSMTVLIGLNHMDEDGESIKTTEHLVSLVNEKGSPEFTTAEYGTIKGALYRFLIKNGIVAGSIK
jgi:hypothetical protein